MSRGIRASKADGAAAAVPTADLFVQPKQYLSLQLIDQCLSRARLCQRLQGVDKRLIRHIWPARSHCGQLLRSAFGGELRRGVRIRSRHNAGARLTAGPGCVLANIFVSAVKLLTIL